MRLGERAAAAPTWRQATGLADDDQGFLFPYLGAPWDHDCAALRSRRKTVSVVIPAWNSDCSIGLLLRSLALCSLNRLAPTRLEVIVCDDGSTDESWQTIRRNAGSLNLRAYRLPHRGQSAALNFGLERARGEVTVCCDSDMIPGCGALDELAARHERWDRVVCIGFRSNMSPSKPPAAEDAALWSLMHREAFSRDNRVLFDVPTLIPNMLVTNEWLDRLSGERGLIDSQGSEWRRHRFLYGCLFSVQRDLMRQVGGFPDALQGWGYNDTLVGVRLEAAGGFLLPVVSAWGHHVDHDLRHWDQWRQYARNKLAYEYLLDQDLAAPLWHSCDDRTTPVEQHEAPAGAAPTEVNELPVTWGRGTLHALGMWKRCLESAQSFGAEALVTECLFRLGRYEDAVASTAGTRTLWGALSHLRAGRPSDARAILHRAALDEPPCAYAVSASRPELLYLAEHHHSIDLPEAAHLYREVAALI